MNRLALVKRAWKEAIKSSIWLLNRHRPGDRKSICLYATRRGGSTWLMEVIAANRGVKYIDQPFSISSASSGQLPYMPLVEGSQYIRLDDEQERKTHAYLSRILDGTLPVNAPWEFWKPDFDFVSHRLVLKIVDAKGLIDWIDRNYDVHTLYCTRHPIPTALSIIRNEWDLTARAYLHHPYFVEHYLDSDQTAYCWDVLHRGSLLKKHVLNWALENLIPLRLLPERPHWLYLSYEETALYPEDVIRLLADRLQLADIDRMRRKIRRPSRSTKKLSSRVEEADTRQALIRQWKKQVSADEERDAMEVLDRLHLSIYQPGDFLPTRRTVVPERTAMTE